MTDANLEHDSLADAPEVKGVKRSMPKEPSEKVMRVRERREDKREAQGHKPWLRVDNPEIWTALDGGEVYEDD